MVHTLNKTNYVHKTLVKSLILMLMLINYIYLERYVTIGFYSTFQQKLSAVAVPGSISQRGPITLVSANNVSANNVKVIARYCISRRNGTIQINKFSLVVAMHPYWKIGDIVLLMLYQGTGGIFLFIDEMLSHRDQTTSCG